MEFLQLGLQRLEVADGMLEGRVGAQRLQLHEVSTDVVQAHVSESPSETGTEQMVEVYCRQETFKVFQSCTWLFVLVHWLHFIYFLQKRERIYKVPRLYLHSKAQLKRQSVCKIW